MQVVNWQFSKWIKMSLTTAKWKAWTNENMRILLEHCSHVYSIYWLFMIDVWIILALALWCNLVGSLACLKSEPKSHQRQKHIVSHCLVHHQHWTHLFGVYVFFPLLWSLWGSLDRGLVTRKPWDQHSALGVDNWGFHLDRETKSQVFIFSHSFNLSRVYRAWTGE